MTTPLSPTPVEQRSLETPDGIMPLAVATPAEPTTRAVIVLQEAFGVNPYIHGVLADLADAGYLAVAPSLFHRTTVEAIPYGDHALIMPHLEALADPQILTDLDAVIEHLAADGFDRAHLGAVGFCIGGRISFLLATHRELGAAVTFYGGGIVTAADAFAERLPSLIGHAPDLRTPWLGLFGDQDRSIPVEDVDALDAALVGSRVPSMIVRYPDAGHAFHSVDRPDFVAAAAADAWTRTMGWLDQHLPTN